MKRDLLNPHHLSRSASILLLIVLLPSCNLIFSTDDKWELDRAYVGIFNTVDRYDAGSETTDAIWVVNDHYDEYWGLNKDYYLDWKGSTFTVSYTDIHTTDNNYIMTTDVEMTGKLSTDRQTLLTFTGTRRLTQYDVANLHYDIVEQYISVRNVPLEGRSDMLSCQISGNITTYIIDAQWKHTVIDNNDTRVSETGALNLSSSNNQLHVTFNKEY
ncbi:MAG: hypothetical protein R6V75_04405 [Bacteroidales bacterium]